jgi:hypothetical protein
MDKIPLFGKPGSMGWPPKDLGANLYSTSQARFKFRTVAKELQYFSWIKNLRKKRQECYCLKMDQRWRIVGSLFL